LAIVATFFDAFAVDVFVRAIVIAVISTSIIDLPPLPGTPLFPRASTGCIPSIRGFDPR
jgi:hypothetical protein